jgi:exopolyphosphatase / guanosine-5'-triphosphate,3'-diphosphate pyrophosphatase
MTNETVETYAAVDVGSNSFHMIVASYIDERIQIIDRIKKMIRLASGLDNNDNLSDESIQRGIECLQEFGQRIREIPHVNVRAVGTNTLRQANNGRRFLQQANKALGHPIEVIAGREEARLIYLGVAHSVFDDTNKRLVIDIGGGSTELILGKGFDVYKMESFYVGCVNMTQRFFESGDINKKSMAKAILAVRQELEPIQAAYETISWDKTIGASGTIQAINSIVTEKGWSSNGITRKALDLLKNEVIDLGNTNRIDLPGLPDNRRPVFVGGLAVLCGIFEAFKIDQLQISDGALREGLLYDLIGRFHDQDIRDRTISELARRYNIDAEQSERVRKTALHLFGQLITQWQLDINIDQKFIEWAAYIHEIGLSIAHAQYHRHGAYLIANSDIAGFSREEQGKLALLVRCHRRKFPLDELNLGSSEENNSLIKLCIILRLAILFNRSRLYASLPKIKLTTKKEKIILCFPEKWIEDNPLTKTDLDQEAGYFNTVGYNLEMETE